ncbi:MAG: NYN domain-containing protein [Candidatus Hydrothermarchaeota archaeon]
MDKAAVFIDGGYFSYVLKAFGEPKIDFEAFSNKLCENANAERFRTYYYDCMPYQSSPPTEEEKERYSRMDRFIISLKKLPRFEVRLGKLGRITRFGQVEFIQKRVDNLLTVDLVRLSWTGKIHKAILVTGDSDFVPVVEEAKNAGVLTQVSRLSR